MLHLFKNQLQTYAQKRNFTRPVYSCERVGPPHAIQFKCKVTVNGQTYESREYFPTLSKAENAAAKVALMSLLPNGVEEVIFLNQLIVEMQKSVGYACNFCVCIF
jgi:dsRNA-specific ribonuclease